MGEGCVRTHVCALVFLRSCPGPLGELFFPGLTGGSEQSFSWGWPEEMM